MVTKDDIIRVAKLCFDPEIPVNIWDLGLIYDINIKSEKDIHIRMSLTTEHCPAAKDIPKDLQKKIESELKVEKVKVEVTFDPPWTPDRISEVGKKQLGITEA